jgi:hypothetical protein
LRYRAAAPCQIKTKGGSLPFNPRAINCSQGYSSPIKPNQDPPGGLSKTVLFTHEIRLYQNNN